MTLIDNPTIGLEQIQREAFYVLFYNLNAQLALVEADWEGPDEIFAETVGMPYIKTELEPVEPTNFHEGHRPSLLKAPPDKYPNVCTMAYRAAPDPSDDAFDHSSVYRDSLFVEAMLRSLISDGEINRRAQRMVVAINNCIQANPTLNGVVNAIAGVPTVQISEVFVRKERTAYGPEWFWQGVRLDYVVQKEAAVPSSSGSIFRPAQYGIDQE